MPCEGEDVTLMTTVSGGSGNYSYQWTGPNGFTSTDANPLISDIMADQEGTYTVVVTDIDTDCVSEEKSVDIALRPNPQITLTPADPTSCVEADGRITISGLTPGETYTVNYSKDGVAQPALTETADADGEIVINNLGVGDYEVSVTGESGCTSDPATTSLENPRVEVSASDETPCEGSDVTLMTTVTGGSGNYSYQWTGPDGFSSTEANPVIDSVTAVKSGTYTVVVTDDVSGCVSKEKSIDINLRPNPQISLTPMDPSSCTENDGSIIISGLQPGESYTVDFHRDGNALPSITSVANGNGEITLGGLGVGIYEVTVTDQEGCTSDPATTTLESPRVEVSVSNSMPCEGEEVTLMTTVTSGSGQYSYQWSGPDGFSSTEANPVIDSVTIANNGTYTVVVTDEITQCVSEEKSVDINVQPVTEVISSPIDPSTCLGIDGAIVVSGLTSGTSYRVLINGVPFEGIADDNGEIISSGFPAADYTVEVKNIDGGGCFSDPASVTLNDPVSPEVVASAADSSLCVGEILFLMADVSGGMEPYTISWAGPDGFVSDQQNPQINDVTAINAGNYTVMVTDAKECTTTSRVDISVSPSPTVIISPDADTLCVSEEITLSTNISGGTPDYRINWYDNPERTGGPFANGASTTVTPDFGQTNYLVEVIDANGCVAVDTSVVNFFPIDAVLDPENGVICDLMDDITLTVINNDPEQVLTYEWMPLDAIITDPADGPVVVVNPDIASEFSVKLANQYGCRDTLTRMITVSNTGDNLDIVAEPSQITAGQSSTITVSGCANCTYQWSPNTSDSGPVVNVTPQITTDYTVTVTDANGCSYELTTTVVVLSCGPEDFFLPSGFTPNGDGVNDELCVRSPFEESPELVTINLVIYNRWGQKVFESNSLGDCWDGTFNGEQLAPDVYGYTLTVTCPDGPFSRSGNITLLR